MTKPSSDMIDKAKVVLKAVRDDNDGGNRALMERLGEFFPHSSDFAWLDDDNDETVGEVFTCEEGGWLEQDQDAEFWQLVSDVDTSDEAWRAPEALAPLIDRMVDAWENAVATQDGTDAAAYDGPRFVSVGPVEGDDYPGWWQGFDQADEVWKYVETGAEPPTDDTPGWVTSALAFPEPVARFEAIEPVPGEDYPGWWQGHDRVEQQWKYVYNGGTPPTDLTLGWAADLVRFGGIEPVPGEDYPGWWQGLDNIDKVWKYVYSGEARPTDQTIGWTIDITTAMIPPAPEAVVAEPPAQLVTLLADAAAAAIKDVRALGVTEEELSDDAIVEALEAEMAVELSAT